MSIEDCRGILLIDKPSGWTSFDVVAKIRRHLGIKKVGHAGTLDPLATGLLIILLGRATKLSDKLLVENKSYIATMSFGQRTDTGDSDGQVIDTDDATWLRTSDIETVLPLFTGKQPQQVPAYSAVKVGGEKLYDLARQGTIEKVERPVRDIAIHSLHLDAFDPTPPFPQATISIHCSKGTYIRVLADDIAAKLGTVAHLTALRRTASGLYTLSDAITLDALLVSPNPQHYIKPVSAIIKG